MAVDTVAYSDQTDEQRAITEMVRQFADEQIIMVICRKVLERNKI